MLSVLLVDDEKNIRTTLSVCLESLGHRVEAVASGGAALMSLERVAFDVAFLDLRLQAENGLDLLPKMLAMRPSLSIVVITAFATIDTAVEAMKRGAVDYLPKPFTPAQIRACVDRVAAVEVPGEEIETSSPVMRGTLEVLERAAQSDAPVLLRGENGTGKTVLARFLHLGSKRSGRPFVTVNCPTLSPELLTSELFGHAEGAFTGAVRDQSGRVEAAEGGTLFLDEIGEISSTLQAKLLRFLQDKEFERIGETRTRHADVRIVCATNCDLEADTKSGRFREDLFYRLNTIEVRVPPLRERREDIVDMARRFLAFFAKSQARTVPELAPGAIEALLAHHWPGNVRELKNVMERASILWPSPLIERDALPESIRGPMSATAKSASSPFLGGDFTIEAIEREHVARVLSRVETLEDAARLLGIDASTLWRKRKRFDEK